MECVNFGTDRICLGGGLVGVERQMRTGKVICFERDGCRSEDCACGGAARGKVSLIAFRAK